MENNLETKHKQASIEIQSFKMHSLNHHFALEKPILAKITTENKATNLKSMSLKLYLKGTLNCQNTAGIKKGRKRKNKL